MNDESRAVSEIERRAKSLYGAAATRDVSGVVHVFSAVESESRLHVIKIGPRAPKSSTDFFVLNFWRAQVDAILTTAAVIRAEPALTHALQGPQALDLATYRRVRLKKPEAPLCAVLTRSGDLPFAHPVWDDGLDYHVLAPPDRTGELSAQLGGRAKVVGLEDLGAPQAVSWLRARGAQQILIEAGPSTASALYDEPGKVNHLLVSRYEGMFDPEAVGGALPPTDRLFTGLSRVASSERTEESGPWRFERWDTTSAPVS
jgi:riboflavin biosynthesis pyrimidine reductase